MRGCYTIICYKKHLKEYSTGSHKCTNIVMLKISFFSLKLLCANISAFQTEPDRGFTVKIIVKQAFPLFLPLLNETIVFSRKKQQHNPLYQSLYKYGR